jgi:hypothetical protein
MSRGLCYKFVLLFVFCSLDNTKVTDGFELMYLCKQLSNYKNTNLFVFAILCNSWEKIAEKKVQLLCKHTNFYFQAITKQTTQSQISQNFSKYLINKYLCVFKIVFYRN